MRPEVRAVLATAIQAASAYGREDLARRLRETEEAAADGTIRVMIVGEFKQGKSSLVNALLNAPVCPVDDDVATSVPTILRYAEEPSAHLIRPVSPPEGLGGTPPGFAETETEAVDVGQLPVYASELGNPGNRLGLLAVEVGLPRSLLSGGITFVDTPGVGGLGSAHTAATVAALPTADVVLFVSDSSQEMTRTEFDFLQAVTRGGIGAGAGPPSDTTMVPQGNEAFLRTGTGPVCGFVMTKTDFYPDWQRIAEINRGHLASLGVSIPVFPTSALLRTEAIGSDDKELNVESGYPDLIDFVKRSTQAAADRATAVVADDMRSVVGQLRSTFESEREVLEDPQRVESITDEFNRAKERTAALKDQAARWQVTLNDGVADLSADFDHRLRGRLRTTTIEAESTLDEQEPGEVWEEFADWLRRRLSYDLAQTYLELTQRTQELSQLVADHFEDGQGALSIQLDAERALAIAAGIDPRTEIERLQANAGTKAMTAMRGSYGGLLMFGMVAQVAGMAMLNPATAGIGLLMGRKAVRDERERQLLAQRQQAKVTARQFIDDTSFEVSKVMKDSLRSLHRRLRDHYQERATEMQRSINDALAAAKDAYNTSAQHRDRRLRDVTAELGRLDQLSTRIDGLLGSTGGAGSTGGTADGGADG